MDGFAGAEGLGNAGNVLPGDELADGAGRLGLPVAGVELSGATGRSDGVVGGGGGGGGVVFDCLGKGSDVPVVDGAD